MTAGRLHDLTGLEQAAAIRAGELDPVELVEHYLARIAVLSDELGAFITVTADTAREQARAAAAEVSAARPGGGDLPPLHGVPIAIKDLTPTAGVRTTFGSLAFADFVPDVDANVALALRAAGSISLGKTNCPELGLPCYTEPDVAPPARTPWDLDRSAGGSSGGAAAAVAGGLLPWAHGNDGGGSIRIPASVCGLVGLKTSRGRVSNGPLLGEVTGLGVQGPLARTVADTAALLDAMAGAWPGDVFLSPPTAGSFLDAARREPGRRRIGRYATPVLADVDLHPDCLAAWEQTSELLAALGHEVVDVAKPFGPEMVADFETVWAVQAASAPVPPDREAQLRPLTRWLRDRGRDVPATEFLAALTRLRTASRAAIVGTDGCDAVLTPTLAQPPALVGGLRDDADPAGDFAAQERFTPYTAPYNLTGQPAITLPLHWTDAGLPIGIQLVGRPDDEQTLLSLGAQLEQARPWRDRRPACW